MRQQGNVRELPKLFNEPAKFKRHPLCLYDDKLPGQEGQGVLGPWEGVGEEHLHGGSDGEDDDL